MSSEPQEDSDREQLSAAGGTIVQNEEDLCGQSRLLDSSWNPQLQLHVTVLPRQWGTEEEDLCKQQKNFNVKQEDPELLLIKEEQEDPEPAQIKDEQEDIEPPQVKEEQERRPKTEPPQIKEEQDELELSQIMEEQERIFFSQNEEQLDLKKETETLIGIPAHEENEDSEGDKKNQLMFNVIDSFDESQREESTATIDEETDPQNRNQMKVRDRGHIQNVDSSHMSESPCDVRKKHNRIILGKKCKKSPKEKKLSSLKFVKKRKKYDSDEEHFVCEKCGKSFSWWSHFIIHIRTHSGEKPFSCKECNTGFSRLSSLKTHIGTHSGEKPYPCRECDTCFSKKSNLKAHMRTHTGEKPFSCNKCDTSFSRISNLKRHMMTHAEQKPFSCEECDRSFSQISHLKTHMRTHTGEKPFSCKDCDAGFSALSCLRRHENSHR